jgi:N4-gp56 family major capsid protein
MANTRAATGLTVQQWDDEFFVEYVQESLFNTYMGEDENSIIQVKNDLTKKQGDSLTFALVNRLTNTGVTGTATLEGNEEDMISRSFRLYVDKLRNAVRVPEMEEQRSAIDLRTAARSALKTWAMEKMRDDVITALGSINGVAYASATETQKDAWLVDNADRVLFGASLSNNSSNDHSASLANIDTTNDKLTTSALSIMKRLALRATPKVRPITVNGGERTYVAFAHPFAFRDLQADTAMQAANRDARERGIRNPLFTGGDLIWDGIVIKMLDDIPIYTDVGAGGTVEVAPVYLCGAQCIGMGWAKRTRSVTETFDYGDKFGVAIEEIRGIAKMSFGSGSADTDDLKDHGLVTGYFAAAND